MNNLATTYQHIADILSFETSNSELEKTLNQPSFDWDAIVIEGSKHLVLPAIYCRLKTKQFLGTIPAELNNYLEEITSINRNRNKAILKQVETISKLLYENKIDHVFLKGSALLASGCYTDNAERMVGDIDILIKKEQIFEAFELLKTNGYNKTFGYAYKKIGFRHLDRLISDHQIAAVELHTELLNKKYLFLMDMDSILKSKIVLNAIPFPNKSYLIKHQILSWQINDKGHYYNFPNFKSIYDTIVLKAHKDKSIIQHLLKLKQGQSYLELAKYYFKEYCNVNSNSYMK
jgi:hypothetical protein